MACRAVGAGLRVGANIAPNGVVIIVSRQLLAGCQSLLHLDLRESRFSVYQDSQIPFPRLQEAMRHVFPYL